MIFANSVFLWILVVVPLGLELVSVVPTFGFYVVARVDVSVLPAFALEAIIRILVAVDVVAGVDVDPVAPEFAFERIAVVGLVGVVPVVPVPAFEAFIRRFIGWIGRVVPLGAVIFLEAFLHFFPSLRLEFGLCFC